IHARHADDNRYLLPGLVARRQMEHGRQRLAAIGDLDPFDLVVGERHVLGEHRPLLLVVAAQARPVLLESPHRGRPVGGGDVIVVARRDQFLVLLVLGRERLAPARHRLERRHDVGILAHALAQRRHVALHLEAAGPQQHAGVTLVPVDAVRLDDVVEHPALLVEGLDMRLADREALGGPRQAGARQCRRGERHGTQECTSMHGDLSLARRCGWCARRRCDLIGPTLAQLLGNAQPAGAWRHRTRIAVGGYRLSLLYCGAKGTGLVLRLVWIAPLARDASRPARTGTLTQGAAPRSILMRVTHPTGVVASRASHQHGLPPEKLYEPSFGMSDASSSIRAIAPST